MIKILQKVLIASMFIVPIAGFIITPNDYVVKSENRVINHFPRIGDKAYFQNLVNFYNDRLLFKLPVTENLYKPMQSVFTDFNFTNSQFTVNGIKGWLFVGNSADSVYSQHCESMNFSPYMVSKKLALLNAIKSSTSAPVYLVIGPDKHGIYSEYMNPYIREPGKFRFFNKIKPYLESQGINVIDNYDVLRANKDPKANISLYYTDDTHWNRYGANIAFDNVMKIVLEDYQKTQYNFSFSKHENGDLIRNISNPQKNIMDEALIINANEPEIKVQNLKSKREYSLKYDPNSIEEFGSKYVNISAQDQRKIMLITDSYGIYFTPYAIEYFRTVVHMHRQTSAPDEILNVLKEENPDLVLFINVERSVKD